MKWINNLRWWLIRKLLTDLERVEISEGLSRHFDITRQRARTEKYYDWPVEDMARIAEINNRIINREKKFMSW